MIVHNDLIILIGFNHSLLFVVLGPGYELDEVFRYNFTTRKSLNINQF